MEPKRRTHSLHTAVQDERGPRKSGKSTNNKVKSKSVGSNKSSFSRPWIADTGDDVMDEEGEGGTISSQEESRGALDVKQGIDAKSVKVNQEKVMPKPVIWLATLRCALPATYMSIPISIIPAVNPSFPSLFLELHLLPSCLHRLRHHPDLAPLARQDRLALAAASWPHIFILHAVHADMDLKKAMTAAGEKLGPILEEMSSFAIDSNEVRMIEGLIIGGQGELY